MKSFPFKNSQVLNYLFWCIMTTAVSWLSYGLFVYLFGKIPALALETSVLISNILSWICAVSFSFVANKVLVFTSKDWSPKVLLPEAVKFFSTRAAAGALEIGAATALVYLGLDKPLFGAEGMTAKAVVTPIVILINYLCGKYVVFKNKG